ncbi:TetR/AcrR family transcriptional regulator [Sphingobium sp. BYY-5]|uniref:TetR/AcrR family transcriptional regulator n=1 Tax=Sphingobium sp. BYY-5 TaxID=2926400 RepID=UPI001FA714D5|nr:TetR/AcrR family transcriptional regulator [Sphingobium sp. BYY-5]MCI4589183.1 TetR/AcrR family transcriptional regulator [Sphingobium sp. BYY-5]
MVAAQQKNDGRIRILATARDLFATKGFHQTSMAHLAAAAQVSVGQIYRLFKDKEDIIEAIVRTDADDWTTHMAALRSQLDAGQISIEQTFEQILLHGAGSEKDEALSFDILAESFRNEVVGKTIGDLCIGFRAYVRDFACTANPYLSGEALEAAEELILASMFGFGHRTLSRPKLTAECAARRAAQMIVAGLKAVD